MSDEMMMCVVFASRFLGLIVAIILLIKAKDWIFRAGERHRARRDVRNYEATLSDAGIDPGDGGSLGNLDTAYREEVDHIRRPRGGSEV